MKSLILICSQKILSPQKKLNVKCYLLKTISNNCEKNKLFLFKNYLDTEGI